MKTNRKIIQIQSTIKTTDVLCDDGTLYLYGEDRKWQKYPDIPQDEIKETNQKTFTKEQLIRSWVKCVRKNKYFELEDLCKELGIE